MRRSNPKRVPQLHNPNLSKKSKIQIEFSDSYSNDNMEIVNVKSPNKKILESTSSDYESSYYSDDSLDDIPPKSEVIQKPIKPPMNPNTQGQTKPRRPIPIKRKEIVAPTTEIHSQPDNTQKIENESNSHDNDSNHSDEAVSPPPNDETQLNQNENNVAQPINEEENQTPSPKKPVNLSIYNNPQFFPPPIDTEDFIQYTIIRTSKSHRRLKLQMKQNEQIIFLSKDKKDSRIPKHLVLSGDSDLEIPVYVCVIRMNNKAQKFTCCSTLKKNDNDDREGQLLSAEFNKKNHLQVVFTKNDFPHYPITDRLSLEHVIEKQSTPPELEDKIIELESKPISQIANSEFSSSFVVHSKKNMILFDKKTGKEVFGFFKSNDNCFQLKIKNPLSCLQAYAIVVSLFKY